MPSEFVTLILCVTAASITQILSTAEASNDFDSNAQVSPRSFGSFGPRDCLSMQIHEDLRPWKTHGITAPPDYNKLCGITSETPISGNSTWPCYFVTLLVENGTLYLTSLFEPSGTLKDGLVFGDPSRDADAAFLAGFLLELLEASLPGTLPDCEFSMFWGDDHEVTSGLEALRKAYASPIPSGAHQDSILPIMLQFSKSLGQPYVLMPFSAHQRCGPDNIDSMLAQRRLKRHRRPGLPWSKRKSKAFGSWSEFCAYWQERAKWPDGSDMGCARVSLLSLSKQNPDLLDISSVDDPTHGYRPFSEHYRHKYAVSTDGWTASSRLEKVFLTGSAVLKQTSPRYTHFEHALRPMEHYVPFWKDNASDILQGVQWLRDHEDEAKLMTRRANEFVRAFLIRPARLCYLQTLVQEISRLMRYKPKPCAERAVCVPLRAQLSFMGHYRGMSPKECDIHDQLNEMYKTKLNHGKIVGELWGDLQ